MKLIPKTQSKSNQEHALLSPSSARKWLACAAALACEADIPNESGQAAIDGTAMHTMAEVQINSIIAGTEIPLTRNVGAYVLNEGKGPIKALAKAQKGAVKITDDFIAQVTKYVDYCRPIIAAAVMVGIEYRVNLTRILHPGAMVAVRDKDGVVKRDDDGNPEMVPLQTFGTADLVALLKRSDGSYMLIVGDLKTGRHKVLAKENKQMMIYALGILRALRRVYDISMVRLVIFQPYSGGPDEWDITPEALDQFSKFASSRALRAIDAFERGKKGLKPADFRPSNDACQWCRFSEKCNAKRKAAIDIAPGTSCSDNDLADNATSTTERTIADLKADWDKLPLLRQFIADTEKAVYAALMRGEKVEGLKLVEGKPGNRAWTLKDEEIEDVMDSCGVPEDLRRTFKVINPTAAEKVLAKEYPRAWRKLTKLVTRKEGAPSIAPADDDRPEWQAAKDDDLAD